MAAAARVHRRDQLKARRIGDVPLGAGDADAAGLERLAERFERGAVELGEFIQEEDPLMRERNLARPGARPAADQCRERGRMMRVAERPLARQSAAAQPARYRLDHAELQRLRY